MIEIGTTFPENEFASIIHWNWNIWIDFIAISFDVKFGLKYAAGSANETLMS